MDEEDFDAKRITEQIHLLTTKSILDLHRNTIKENILKNDYLLYLFNKSQIRIYLKELSICKAEVIKTMFGL